MPTGPTYISATGMITITGITTGKPAAHPLARNPLRMR